MCECVWGCANVCVYYGFEKLSKGNFVILNVNFDQNIDFLTCEIWLEISKEILFSFFLLGQTNRIYFFLLLSTNRLRMDIYGFQG